MNISNVILIGFSTVGKSFYLEKIEKEFPTEFSFFDSDKYVSSAYDGHIFNIFMQIGRDAAIDYIENKEREFLQFISNFNRKPRLIAAGPFLIIRDGWDKFIEKRNPYIIHLEKSPESICKGLLQRRAQQKEKLDTSNSNFGSWDKDVTTELSNGVYQDISASTALENIKMHLDRINPIYEKYRKHYIDSDSLYNDNKKQQEFIQFIIDRLREKRS